MTRYAPHLTGLCSYVLTTGNGEYIYNPTIKLTGYGRDLALVYLWTPEEVADRVAELEPELSWAGRIRAVRSRA